MVARLYKGIVVVVSKGSVGRTESIMLVGSNDKIVVVGLYTERVVCTLMLVGLTITNIGCQLIYKHFMEYIDKCW